MKHPRRGKLDFLTSVMTMRAMKLEFDQRLYLKYLALLMQVIHTELISHKTKILHYFLYGYLIQFYIIIIFILIKNQAHSFLELNYKLFVIDYLFYL